MPASFAIRQSKTILARFGEVEKTIEKWQRVGNDGVLPSLAAHF
jgi:hypothetical protein